MGLAYLFALIVALGLLGVQILMGGRDAHGHFGHVGHAGHAHAHDAQGAQTEPAFWTLLLSLRFWLFAALGFGLSGSLLHYLSLATPSTTLLVALLAALASGLFAVIAFRMLRRGSHTTESRSSVAVGRVGRVVVPFGKGVTGQVRVEIGGSSIDLVAIAEDETFAKGEAVLVEDLREGKAVVSRRPSELG